MENDTFLSVIVLGLHTVQAETRTKTCPTSDRRATIRATQQIFKNVNKVRRRECREQYVNVVRKVMDLQYDEIDRSYRTEASNLMQKTHLEKQQFFYMQHIHIFFKIKPGMYWKYNFQSQRDCFVLVVCILHSFLLKLLQ